MKLRHASPVVTFLLAVLPLCAQESSDCPLRPATLAAMRQCYRPLLVFAPATGTPLFKKQQALLDEYADEMMDRNILYVPVPASAAGFNRPLDAPYAVLSRGELAAIRKRFQVDAGKFLVILLNERGAESFRSEAPVSVLRLDAIVDKSARAGNTP
jgi:hypothetical protein